MGAKIDNKKLKSSLMILLTAFIWGLAFVAQSVGMDYVGPFTFQMSRNLLSGVVLIPVILLFDRLNGKKRKREMSEEEKKAGKRDVVAGGILCGVALFIGSSFQQMGLKYTTVGKAGFITALYIIIVPIVGIFAGKKVGKKLWGSVLLAVIGMYLLCVTEEVSINPGDLLEFLGACGFTMHILVVDHFTARVDGVRMSCIQFFVCALLSAVGMLFTETFSFAAIQSAWMTIVYAGVLSGGVGYTLQILAQRDTEPTVASLLFSMESVFAMLAGWVILGQSLTPVEMAGCALVFAGIILAQL